MSKTETVTLVVKKPFNWAHEHVRVVEYSKDEIIETSDQDLIDVSTKEGWTERQRATKKKAGDDVKAQIAALEEQIASASDEAKPALQQALAELQAQQ